MRISQLIMDVVERIIPLPPVPRTPPPSVHLSDETLLEVRTAIEHLQAEQRERLLELYAEVVTGLATAEEEPP